MARTEDGRTMSTLSANTHSVILLQDTYQDEVRGAGGGGTKRTLEAQKLEGGWPYLEGSWPDRVG